MEESQSSPLLHLPQSRTVHLFLHFGEGENWIERKFCYIADLPRFEAHSTGQYLCPLL